MAKTIDDPDWTLGCAFMRMPQGWATVHTRVRSQGGYFVRAVADRRVRVNRVHSGGHLRILESAWAAQYDWSRLAEGTNESSRGRAATLLYAKSALCVHRLKQGSFRHVYWNVNTLGTSKGCFFTLGSLLPRTENHGFQQTYFLEV